MWKVLVALFSLAVTLMQANANNSIKGAVGGYPVSGAYAFVDKTNSETAGRACQAFAKFGLRRLSGNAAGELVVFDHKRRLDFGGYADTETKNISVNQISEREFAIVDQWYDDGEDGSKPGLKRTRYTLKILDPSTLEIVDQYGAARYTSCSSVETKLPVAEEKPQLPERLGDCKDTEITRITDRFGKPLSVGPSTEGSDPGTMVQYRNGGTQVSYDKETAILRSRLGDKVNLCLKEIPKDCPPGDKRGRIYNTRNLRTGEAWTLPDSQHSCGGA
jgi:hypothetical protein